MLPSFEVEAILAQYYWLVKRYLGVRSVCQVSQLKLDKNCFGNYDGFMHVLQEKLLNLIKDKNISGFTLRDIGDAIGIEKPQPQQIKHHLEQLQSKGFIRKLNDGDYVAVATSRMAEPEDRLTQIPVLGSASCGLASQVAEEDIEGYIQVSSRLLPAWHSVFAVKAKGDSMNAANINGEPIEDGDIVLIDSDNRTPNNGDYVLSVIGGLANIKRFYRTSDDEIILKSESSVRHRPILIHKDDVEYVVCGKVLRSIPLR
jgi:SOS-response transcriptional repressor LexA